MTTLVVGVTSAGKSTLVNALLGRFVMPVGVMETTTCPVVVDRAATYGVRTLSIDDALVNHGSDASLREGLQAAFSMSPAMLRVSIRPLRNGRYRSTIPRWLPTSRKANLLVDLPGVLSANDEARLALVGAWANTASRVIVALSAEDTDDRREAALLAALRGAASRQVVVVLGRADAFAREGGADALAQVVAARRALVRRLLDVDVDVLPVSAHAALAAEVLGPGRHIASPGDLDHLGRTHLGAALLSGAEGLPRRQGTWTRTQRRQIVEGLFRASGIVEVFAALRKGPR
jgi:hypothetical protein